MKEYHVWARAVGLVGGSQRPAVQIKKDFP